jgi:hypothetical protein
VTFGEVISLDLPAVRSELIAMGADDVEWQIEKMKFIFDMVYRNKDKEK